MDNADTADGQRKKMLKSGAIREGSQVAVKMLPPERASEKQRRNFMNEINIVSDLWDGIINAHSLNGTDENAWQSEQKWWQ
jgi:hypothetical protein